MSELGSNSEVGAPNRDVCFTPINGPDQPACQVRKVPTGDSRSRFFTFFRAAGVGVQSQYLAYKGKSSCIQRQVA